ncbi:unnamed protein product [Closterium sp. Naga37s-1]|nr:unnamed protein product [Closterium sp. Naga37s-1]
MADLTKRYLTNNKPFGGESKSGLVGFLKLHGQGGGKKVRVRGVDGEGRPVNHLYTMHDRKLSGHKCGSTYAECVKLCRMFARDCVDNLNERLDDLGKLGPTTLFRAGKWLKIKAQWERKCRVWLLGCSKIFRNKLTGFDLKAAERELPTFCAIMVHHELESFKQCLTNILRSTDSKRSMRRRRPAKSTKLAMAERGRKGKEKEGEDEVAGTAGQNEEEEGEEEEEDVEQDLGDDQEVVGEEEDDNPFLSDDEDMEEVFHIDKPVH